MHYRIAVIDKANAGYGAAMNDGLRAATGEFISIVESDDYVLPEMLERYYGVAFSMGLDFVKSDFRIFWGDGKNRRFQDRRLTDKTAYYGSVLCPRADSRLFRCNNLTQPGLYRSDFIESKQIRYHESAGASYQDNGFWFQVFAQAESAMFLREAYYMLRRDNPNSSIKNKGKVYCICEEYDYIRSLLTSRGLSRFLGVCAWARFSNYEWTCQRIDDRFLVGFFEKYAADFRFLEEAGELDRKLFSPSEWARLQTIMREGGRYYLSGWLPRKRIRVLGDSLADERRGKDRAVQNAVSIVKRSNSYRIGRLVTKPARMVKRFFPKALKALSKSSLSRSNIKYSCDRDVYEFNSSIPEPDIPEHLVRLYAENMQGQLDLSNPLTYNEKVQYRKWIDPQRSLKTILSDKYLAREWVKGRVGEGYLVPLLGVWENFDEINFDELPSRFVLKATHGCAMTMVVRSRKSFDRGYAREQFNVWLKTNFAFCNGLEMHYRDIEPRIIAEQYMENADGDLFDYKFWCFGGRVHYVQYLSGRSKKLKMSFFDRNWVLQPFRYDHPNHEETPERPQRLDEMIEVAEKLAQGFDHVRVDLYETREDGVKFGEMTFSSASGYCNWSPPEADALMGDLWNLDFGSQQRDGARDE